MKQMTRMGTIACLGLLALTAMNPTGATDAIIDFDPKSAPMLFAVDDIEAALRARNFTVKRRGNRPAAEMQFRGGVWIRFEPANVPGGKETPGMKAEGYSIIVTPDGPHRLIVVFSNDAGGAMYGGLELAEQIRARGVDGVVDTDRNPYMPLRGTKFNLPLDLRTPSYSDMSDAAQENIATVWDMEFWRGYLDRLARDRYNFVALWNLHPFPSMVKVPGYADVALQDVWRSKVRFEEDYSTRTTDIVTPAMLANHEVVRQLTIEQKIAFWREVMSYAKSRNIDVYVVTWNVYTYGVGGKHGITDAIDDPQTRDYFRASVREMFRTYPLLRGIGLTVGENMGEASFQAKEDWAFATYGQGVLDAARAEPNRRIRLIHRQHEARAPDIAATFAPLIGQPNVEFDFSFKYAQAHALSSTTQTFHRGYVESLGPLKTFWTIRNDDALMFRWAAPAFVREFVKNIPYAPSRGYYYGSDMWIWGREFLDKAPAGPRPLEIDKHWLAFALWGRLGYDPTLDDARITALVAQRFPGVDAARLLGAWQDASMVYPLVTGFHWADFDFQWYIEACRSRAAPARTASGFHSVETFITQKVHPGTDNVPIPKYVTDELAHAPHSGTTPLQVAASIDARANAALAALDELGKNPATRQRRELAATLEDIRAMALLGRYYARKIRGATALAMFRKSGSAPDQAGAVRELLEAEAAWRDYSSRVRARYRNPLWTNRVGTIDWDELNGEVARDVEMARGAAVTP